jgi:DNA repair ATPase RecN
MKTSEILKKLEDGKTERNLLASQLSKRKEKLENLKALKLDLEGAQAIIQETARQTQETLKFHIKDLSQAAIDSVFPAKYDVMVDFDLSHNTVACDLYLDRNGYRLDPMDSNGGGLVDVMSLALRVACWSMGRTRNVLFLDEPLKNVSVKYRPVVVDFMKGITKKLGLQMIMVTHDPEIISAADRVFLVTQKGKHSKVEQRDNA